MTKRKYPRKIGSIINQLMARRGYGQIQTTSEMQKVFEAVLGPALASQVRPGNLRRGTLEVAVPNSVVGQELAFQKRQIVKALKKEFPASEIDDIRCRVS